MSIDLNFDPKNLNEEDLVQIVRCFEAAYALPMNKYGERSIRVKGMKSIRETNQFRFSYVSKGTGQNGTVSIKIYDNCIGIQGNLERTEEDQRKRKKEFENRVKEYFQNRTTEENGT